MAREPSSVVYRDEVRREWVDYNGHLRDAFYLLIFSFATDALLDAIGLDTAQRAARGRSMYTLEAHLNYLHEIGEGARVSVQVSVVEHDARRVHLYLQMFADNRPEPVAASEQMLLHVDTSGPRAAPFDADVLARVAQLREAGTLPADAYVGQVIGLRKRRDEAAKPSA